MSGPAIRPRPDQIDELTRGIELPLPGISEDHLLVLAEGLYEAFTGLCIDHPAVMISGDEPAVTALLESRLNHMLGTHSPWRHLVQCVARGKESISFDGSHLEKRPDLSLYLSDRTRNFPLIVEAKILDHSKGKTVTSYCRFGLMRFINGEYAWGTQEAFMLGYVRDGASIDSKLKPLLVPGGTPSDDYSVEELPIPVRLRTPDLAYTTRHRRSFVYSQAPPKIPGPISIWHLWLSCPSGT